ncbi:MAG: glycosyltransferase family 4 protein [Methylococcales bacterium]
MTTKIALVRQEQMEGDGGAQAIIDIILDALGSESSIDVSLLCRHWEAEIPDTHKVILDPPYRGRIAKIKTFNHIVKDYLNTHHFDLVQSHERFSDCDIFRAGDGVHKVWLEQKARLLNPLSKAWLFQTPYHKSLMAEEKKMFESSHLRAVICNSKMVGDEILEHFDIAPKKIKIIHNGVDIERFHPKNRSHAKKTRHALGIPEECLLFIFPGSGFERKNLITVIRALSHLPENIHTMIVGRDKWQRRYERLANKTNIGHRVHFLGAQKRERMPELYAAADALILPTLYDPFPNVIFEAMATGLPCITSPKCGAAIIIQDNKAGRIVDALNEVELAGAMTAYESENTRNEEGKAARTVAEQFTIQRMRKEFIRLYRDLIKSKFQ